VNFLGHGDTQQIILLPGGVDECFEFGWRAFDIAEQLQWPVFVLSDLDMGMNQWMSKPFAYPDGPMKRGKILWRRTWRLSKAIGRAILTRTTMRCRIAPFPETGIRPAATSRAAPATDEQARYTEDAATWHRMTQRLKKKYETARKFVPAPVMHKLPGARAGIIAFGSTEAAVLEAQHQLAAEQGLKADFMRVRALPLVEAVDSFVESHEPVFVVEDESRRSDGAGADARIS